MRVIHEQKSIIEYPQKEFTGKLTVKGQVTVPQEIRKMLGVEPQQAVIFRVTKGQVELLPAPVALEDAFGAVSPLNKPEDFKELRDVALEERLARYKG